jgi:transcriptional regulator with XRE-family HTH domain
MDLKEVLAANVRRARHASKITQEELADRAALSARYLGSIERATVSASVTILGRLAKALTVGRIRSARRSAHQAQQLPRQFLLGPRPQFRLHVLAQLDLCHPAPRHGPH